MPCPGIAKGILSQLQPYDPRNLRVLGHRQPIAGLGFWEPRKAGGSRRWSIAARHRPNPIGAGRLSIPCSARPLDRDESAGRGQKRFRTSWHGKTAH